MAARFRRCLMVVEGVVVNGRVEAKLPKSWPEGSVVTLALVEPDELDAMPPMPEVETEAEFIESIRQELADIDAGIPGMSVEQAFAAVDDELRRLAAEGKCKP